MAEVQSTEFYIEEEGYVIAKEYKEARPSWTDKIGRIVPATEEKYIVKVVSCSPKKYSFSNGMTSKPTMLDYQVEKKVFDSIHFDNFVCPRARVGFTSRTYEGKQNLTPDYVSLITTK